MHPQKIMTFFSILGIGAALQASDWRNPTRLPRGLASPGIALVADDLWIAGGSYWDQGEKKLGREIWRWRRVSSSWEVVGLLANGFGHGGSAVSGKYLWLAGGFDSQGPSGRVSRIDLETGATAEIATLPEPRAYCGAAILEGALWVVGGTKSDADFSRAEHTLLRVNLQNGHVTTESTDAPALINPLVLALNGELHVLPGSIWSGAQNRLVVPEVAYVYSPATREWKKRALQALLPRGMSGAALTSHQALVTGGVATQAGKTIFSAASWIYDARESTFTVATPLPAGRLAPAIVGDAAAVIVAGGEDGAKSRADSVWELSVRKSTDGDKRK